MARRALIAGNWKMHGRRADVDWVRRFTEAGGAAGAAEAVLCPPATLLGDFADPLKAAGAALGAQDCAAGQDGAHTGDVSAPMLAEFGCRYVIVGHSERRATHGEDDALVRAKADAALAAGLVPIVCVGESAQERDRGEAEAIVSLQVKASAPEADAGRIVIAYEPVWAIGSGRTPSADDIAAMHAAVRSAFPGANCDGLRVLYGGSVKPGNAAEILAVEGVDGALVGGASLDPEGFARIVNADR